MNIFQQFNQIFKGTQRAAAVIVADNRDGSYLAQTTQAHSELILYGSGFQAGQTVYYDMADGRILGVAPDLEVWDIGV